MLPHGSILGIFDGPNPMFEDCIASGFLEFNSGNLFLCHQREGGLSYSWLGKGGAEEKRLATSGKKHLGSDANVIVDTYILGSLAHAFMLSMTGIGRNDFGCFAAHLALVASGAFDIRVFGDNCQNPKKLKTGEEIGLGYLIVKEAGGLILDWNGKDFGPEEIGLGGKKTFHGVIAATKELGKEFVGDMRKNRDIVGYMKKKNLL